MSHLGNGAKRAGESRPRWTLWALWLPGLLVALGAGAATAHGLFVVAVAAKVPAEIAWIYPLITDGLALVAYVATSQLPAGSARRYAWSVVMLAAGLSGLAQAVFLAGGVTTPAEPTATGGAPVLNGGEPVPAVSPMLGFGVGAWPAVAAAVVAHLLFLIASERIGRVDPSVDTKTATSVQPEPSVASSVGPAESVQSESSNAVVQRAEVVQPEQLNASTRPSTDVRPSDKPEFVRSQTHRPSPGTEAKPERPVPPSSPKRDRALREARKHQALSGSLPTVDQLSDAADVSRGTAGTVLKELREQPHQLHVITELKTSKAEPT